MTYKVTDITRQFKVCELCGKKFKPRLTAEERLLNAIYGINIHNCTEGGLNPEAWRVGEPLPNDTVNLVRQGDIKRLKS